jgi:predicted Zn-dependent protease
MSLPQWVRAQGGIETDAASQDRLERAAIRLSRGHDQLPVRVAVLATDAVSAYSWPDGQIFVTRGLLNRISDDQELAAAIAHELGHLLDDRHVRLALSLRGRENADDLEARADAIGASLLEAQHIPRGAMPSLLRKVAATMPPAAQEPLLRRARLLEEATAEAAPPGPSAAR